MTLVQRGRRLEYFTILYNSLEGVISIGAGLMASSIALIGFGFDSVIEVTSAGALLWRLHTDLDEEQRERVEAISLRIVGVCFLALAAYVTCNSVKALWAHEPPHRSLLGIGLASVSLVVMPFSLAPKGKSRVTSTVGRSWPMPGKPSFAHIYRRSCLGDYC